MFIKNCLSPQDSIETITPSTTIRQAITTLSELELESLPVVDEHGTFLGITGYTYIFKEICTGSLALDETAFDQPVIIHKMNPLLITDDFEDTLPLIVRYPFVPIVDEDGYSFLGIVKISDIERGLVSTYGNDVPGTRFLLGVLNDVPHVLEHVLDAVKPTDSNIISIATFDAGSDNARRILLKVESEKDTEKIKENLEQSGFRILSIKEK
ncbi:CBS domain-containing protein [Mechercharimyces sp. CAU 1602]|uniref:CBS domain-containing protein n=1 Tax=Mechercharimyces sp. CAU 1602 TaxID=2973933 RepID=UPI0021633F75|nr:CBS domain-containing protein [Mechercharimyces sp. CAU 1602]MCS1352005.1 CBS domain-containing protein [Mechercharimyces sp. CAU 1602]